MPAAFTASMSSGTLTTLSISENSVCRRRWTNSADINRTLGACLSNDRRSEGDPDRAGFCDRFPRIAGAYVRETIAERCRSGVAAVGEHRSARLLGRGRGGRGTRLIRFQHVAEAAQSPHLQPEGSESTAQTVYADLDRG